MDSSINKTDIKQSSMKNQSDDDEFTTLSYTDVQINLRLLSDLKEGEKIMVHNNCMQIDQRYVQPIRRFFSSDSRDRTLQFIHHLINSTKKICNDTVDKVNHNVDKKINLEKLIRLQSLLKSASIGLGRMILTYKEDKLNLATIETYKASIDDFCDQDIKKIIDLQI